MILITLALLGQYQLCPIDNVKAMWGIGLDDQLALGVEVTGRGNFDHVGIRHTEWTPPLTRNFEFSGTPGNTDHKIWSTIALYQLDLEKPFTVKIKGHGVEALITGPVLNVVIKRFPVSGPQLAKGPKPPPGPPKKPIIIDNVTAEWIFDDRGALGLKMEITGHGKFSRCSILPPKPPHFGFEMELLGYTESDKEQQLKATWVYFGLDPLEPFEIKIKGVGTEALITGARSISIKKTDP